MTRRNTWRSGDYLAVDDESGLTHYASEMARDWDGTWKHKDNLDGRHPQLDVKSRRDPIALSDIRPRASTAAAGDYLCQQDGVSLFILEDGTTAPFSYLLCETVTVR